MLLEFPADQELDVVGDCAVLALGGLLELLLQLRGDADMDGISVYTKDSGRMHKVRRNFMCRIDKTQGRVGV